MLTPPSFSLPEFDHSQTTRFAPSPTGELHLGHAYAALIAHDIAAQSGGTFLLRIDDIDTTRSRGHFVEQIYADLEWLGLVWEEAPLVQSTRLGAYADALEQLQRRGLTYPCFCTRTEIQSELANLPSAPHGPEGPIYPGTCKKLDAADRENKMAKGQPFAVRLNVSQVGTPELNFEEHGAGAGSQSGPQTVRPDLFGDLILARKDIGTSYHLATVLDDAHQGATLVTRGEDLAPASHIQRLLQHLLDLPPVEYLHHPLIRRADGKRLAKRDKDTTLCSMRESGVTPQEIRDRLGLVR